MKTYVKLVVDPLFCLMQCIGGGSFFRREFLTLLMTNAVDGLSRYLTSFIFKKLKELLNEDRQ